MVGQSTVIPLEKYGLRVMSMGFFLDDSSPVIWRGPLVTGLMRQFLKDVRWGELDVLVVDMPPGTGDVALTLVQQVPLAGGGGGDDAAAGVADRRRARHRHVPPGQHAGARRDREHERLRLSEVRRRATISSAPAARAQLEQRFGIPVLGRIPIEPAVRIAGDAGTPDRRRPARASDQQALRVDRRAGPRRHRRRAHAAPRIVG